MRNTMAIAKSLCPARHHLLIVAAACLAATQFGGAAWAQRYDQKNPKLTASQARAMRTTLQAILSSNGALSDDDKKTLNAYYLGYRFPALTNASPDALAELAADRKGLIRDLNQIKSQTARAYLLDITLKQMMTFAANVDGNYHPAVRFNATLIIGELDQSPAQTGSGAKDPTIWPDATKTLLSIVKTSKIAVGPPPVKVAALVGLARHAQFGIDEQLAQPTTDEMLSIITAEQPPEHLSKDVFHWMQCQAASVLAAQYSDGINDTASTALTSLIADDVMRLDDRCFCASLLTAPMFSGASGAVDYDALQAALGGLAKAVLAAEAKKANDYNDELLRNGPGGRGGYGGGRGGGYGGGEGYGRGGGGYGGGEGYGRGGGGYGRGGYGGGLGDAEELGPRYEIRRMLDRVMGVMAGLDAVTPASGDPVQSQLAELKTALQQLADAAAERDALEAKIAEVVIQTSRVVNQMVDTWQPAEEPEAPVAAANNNAGALASSE